LTPEVEKWLEKQRSEVRSQKTALRQAQDKVTRSYQDLLTMREYGIPPAAWARISRFDRLVLFYGRIMEHYYTERERARAKEKAEKEAERQRFLKENMPKVKRR